MSTRYVWSRYNRKFEERTTQSSLGSVPYGIGVAFGLTHTFDQNTGLFTMHDCVVYPSGTGTTHLKSNVRPVFMINVDGIDEFGNRDSVSGNTLFRDNGNGNEWELRNGNVRIRDDFDGEYFDSIDREEPYMISNTKLSDVSSPNSGAYPQNGVSGSNWYEYEGSDNIDPSSVSIPAVIMPSQQITITVTPGTGKVYGGTVSYQYQVRLDGGAWQTVATTTATTQTYTVPAGTQSIQARVRAQDNMGFTSTTYVESAAVTVTNTPASITVPGAAMVGQSLVVSWEAVEGADAYKLERRINSGSWTTVYTGPGLSYTDTAVVGWSRVQYRVSAGTGGAYGTPLESDTVDIISAASLVISGADGSLGTITAPVTYSVTSDTGNQITVTETINGHSRTLNPASGAQIAIPVSMIDPAADDAGEITIQASVQATSGTVTQTRNWTYTKTPLTLPTKAYRVEQLQGEAKDVMPLTLAEAVMMPDGSSVADKLGGATLEGAAIGTFTRSVTLPFTPDAVWVVCGYSATNVEAKSAMLYPDIDVYIQVDLGSSNTDVIKWDGNTKISASGKYPYRYVALKFGGAS